MKKLISGLWAGGLAVTFALTSVPVNAAPIFVAPTASVQSDVVQIQDSRKWRKNRSGNNWNGNNNFRRDGNSAYYNGHRGYSQKRRGYDRQHNGFWFPAGAFIAGAVIGGAIMNNNNRGGSAHVQWCYDQYRSYRASDNTFQPNYGGRRHCNSPYS